MQDSNLLPKKLVEAIEIGLSLDYAGAISCQK